MAWQLEPALIQLQKELDKAYPNRTKPDWTIGDADHRTRQSDHNPNAKGYVCAIDVRGKNVAALVAEHIKRSRDVRIKYVIFDGHIYSSYDHSEGNPFNWRPYRGSNPHSDHVHISVYNTLSDKTWNIANVEKEEDVEVVAEIQKCLIDAGYNLGNFDPFSSEYPPGADGDFGPKTRGALTDALKKARQGSGSHSHKGTVTVR